MSTQKKITRDASRPISLTEAASVLKIAMKAELDDSFKTRIVPILLGPPGQGKSAIPEQLIAELNEEREIAIADLMSQKGLSKEEATKKAGPEWTLLSYRLGQCDPTDLKGVPLYENVDGQEMCTFAPPKEFPMKGIKGSARGKNVLIFLDELPQALPAIQNLGANIIDGKVGDCTIDPTRSFIVCAGNRIEDMAATYDIPRNVGNRLVKLTVQTSAGEWVDWASRNRLNPLVIGYIKNHTEKFNTPPPSEGFTYPTPRSWHKVSVVLNSLGEEAFERDKADITLVVLQGLIGVAEATAFWAWARAAREKFSIDKIMAGTAVPVPEGKDKDALFSLMLEGAFRVDEMVAKAVSSIAYQDSLRNDVTIQERAKIFVDALGTANVNKINNLYSWVAKSGMDPSFLALLNKYQNMKTKDHFRSAMMNSKNLELAMEAYLEINTRLK